MFSHFYDAPSGDVSMLDRRSPRPRVSVQTVVALEDYRETLKWLTWRYRIPFRNFEEPDYLIKILRGECRSLGGTFKSEEIRRGEVRTSFVLHRRAGGDSESVSSFVGTYVSGKTGFWVPSQVSFFS